MSVEWCTSNALVAYENAEVFMQQRIKAIQDKRACECVWLLEHPPLYTVGAGTIAKAHTDLIDAKRFPIHKARRGGKYTYHGPGQRICYVMVDLGKRDKDLRHYIRALEQWGMDAFALCGVETLRSNVGVGLWVMKDKAPQKIAAIGVRVSQWVTSYGIAFNVSPDLDHYKGIIPCGIKDYGVTSLHALGRPLNIRTFDAYLKKAFQANSFLSL
mgnify:CR=1 FL=1